PEVHALCVGRGARARARVAREHRGDQGQLGRPRSASRLPRIAGRRVLGAHRQRRDVPPSARAGRLRRDSRRVARGGRAVGGGLARLPGGRSRARGRVPGPAHAAVERHRGRHGGAGRESGHGSAGRRPNGWATAVAAGPGVRRAAPAHRGAARGGGHGPRRLTAPRMPGAREHLERLAAHPRPAGSPAEGDAREWCRTTLAAAGFEVTAEPFSYSAVPGRAGTPALGVAGIAVVCIGARIAADGHPWRAALVLAAAGVVVATAGAWIARVAVTRLPWGRREGINLLATRGGAPPRLWLSAHLDSKSQPVPILLRAAGVSALLVVWIVAIAVAA